MNPVAYGIAIGFGCLIMLPVVAIVGIHIYAYGWILFDGLRLRRLLRAQNRLLSLSDAKRKIKQGQGIIILDAPTLGWNVCRVWWSPTKDFVSSPKASSNDRWCAEEDIINYNKFIEPTSGSAMLIVFFVFTQRTKKFLKRHFGSSDCGFVFTGGVLTQLQMDKKQADVLPP